MQPKKIRRLHNGIYKVTLIGQGTGNGVVIVRDGKFGGGDGYFYYSGTLNEEEDRLTAEFEVARHTPGGASVFGKDVLEASLTGPPAGAKDFQLHGPSKIFSIAGTWLAEDFEARS